MNGDSSQKRTAQTVAKKAAMIVLEVLLVAVIIGLIVATWLPAMIGANPDVGAPLTHHRR
jgi:hypothetical protein